MLMLLVPLWLPLSLLLTGILRTKESKVREEASGRGR